MSYSRPDKQVLVIVQTSRNISYSSPDKQILVIVQTDRNFVIVSLDTDFRL